MHQLQKFKKLQSGFTLIEIAIVMVIIGLLLGGVLKGQEMITNAQIKRAINDFDGIGAGVYGYLDRYTALPGDDSGAIARFAALDDGDANGVVAGAWDAACADAAADPESCDIWEHMRLSGLISGSGNIQPTNAFGGIMGIENGATGASTLAGHIICMAGVSGDIAVLIDSKSDDGDPTTGSIRSMIGGAAPVAPYVAASVYEVCRTL